MARVNAGCRDEPPEYPGLAHFLEHLVFLGSADYPAADGLLPFVQRGAGQVNACTRERHTDYFFEVPAAALKEGLRRLLDMLARPLLEREAQSPEREVLHAEFMTRAADAETLRDAVFGSRLSGQQLVDGGRWNKARPGVSLAGRHPRQPVRLVFQQQAQGRRAAGADEDQQG